MRSIKAGLQAKDQEGMNVIMMRLVLEGRSPEEVQALAEMLLLQEPHDVQEWWNGECNCDGHQN